MAIEQSLRAHEHVFERCSETHTLTPGVNIAKLAVRVCNFGPIATKSCHQVWRQPLITPTVQALQTG